jgi:hypothetical protein
VRLLALLLILGEPLECAAAAAGAFNAIAVRGWPVAAVLAARLASTALCIAAGRALIDVRPAAPVLARGALVLTATVRVFALSTPYFPSNRLPGQTPIYVGVTVAYYGAWLWYLWRSRRVARTYH